MPIGNFKLRGLILLLLSHTPCLPPLAASRCPPTTA
jgi:hypothetical protein